MKIAVYAISKNEEKFVERFAASCAEADLILLADTGSTDGTADKARECGVLVYDICVSPWRFDVARNTALSLVPRDFDVCIALDVDEVLEPGWRAALEAAWRPGTTRLRYPFAWSQRITFLYDKIHARHGYRWHHPVHEYPVPDRIEEVYAHAPGVRVTHLPDPTKSRGQYLGLLELSVREDPQCPRNAFYLGREYTFCRMWREAETALLRYLSLPGANWNNERAYAMRLLADCCDWSGRYDEATKWRWMAVAEAPGTREPWCELAAGALRREDWTTCLFAAERALGISDKQPVYMQDPEAWGARPWDLAAVANWRLGNRDEALRYGREAVRLAPSDTRIRNNMRMFAGGSAAARESA